MIPGRINSQGLPADKLVGETPEQHNTRTALSALKVGDKIAFAEEKQRYTVRAAGDRYLVCTKPFNPRRTVIYTIVDKRELIRGTENLIFSAGAETDEQCTEMLARLEGRDPELGWRTEVSHRNNIPVRLK